MDILDLLKDKTKLIEFLINSVQNSSKTTKGLRSLAEGENSEEFKTKKLLEIVANQNIQIRNMSIILLCYSQSNSFDSDIGQMMVKMGRGEEALQQMFKNKFK